MYFLPQNSAIVFFAASLSHISKPMVMFSSNVGYINTVLHTIDSNCHIVLNSRQEI